MGIEDYEVIKKYCLLKRGEKKRGGGDTGEKKSVPDLSLKGKEEEGRVVLH